MPSVAKMLERRREAQPGHPTQILRVVQQLAGVACVTTRPRPLLAHCPNLNLNLMHVACLEAFLLPMRYMARATPLRRENQPAVPVPVPSSSGSHALLDQNEYQQFDDPGPISIFLPRAACLQRVQPFAAAPNPLVGA